jgi:hypothetical protein
MLAEKNGLELAVVLPHVEVVKIGGDFQTGVADRPQRQGVVVEVNQIGFVFVNEVNRAIVEFIAVSLVGNACAVAPVPLAVNGIGIGEV